MKTLYSSNRTFRLWAYTISYSSLLLRSEMKYPDQDDFSKENSYNIDFEFWAVRYVDVPADFHGVVLKKLQNRSSLKVLIEIY
jgi:hypothetical protein